MRNFFPLSLLAITLVELMSSAYFNVCLFCLGYYILSPLGMYLIGNINLETIAAATKERDFPPSCLFAILAVLLFHKSVMLGAIMLL